MRWWSGIFIGLGSFQLFDGIVSHKLLQIHQIRYGVELLPYDIAWIASAILLLAVGIFMWLKTRKSSVSKAGG
ncbi:DUF2243 domain-containing protein [Salinicoccus sp. Marseille-QA3877]